MDVNAVWKHALTFENTTGTGFTLRLGAIGENGEEREGASPMETILVALASCTGMDVISILHKKRQEVNGFEVKVHGDRTNEHPKVFTHVKVEYIITGRNIDPAAAERAVELSTTKYCSVHAMLIKAVEIEHKITIREG
jgi:putative redox protein